MKKRIGIDLRVAALAFFIALLLWFHVVTERRYVQEVEIPLSVGNEPQEFVLVTAPPRTVRLKIGGTGKELLSYNLGRERHFCRLDVPEARRGEVTYLLGEENFELPYGLELVDISDSQLKLKFDRRVKKSVLVRASVTGSAKEGYTVVREIIEPEKISLSGPETLLKNVDIVESEPVNMDESSEPFEIVAGLVQPEGRGWRLTPDSVLIEFLIEKILAVTYDSIVVKERNRPGKGLVSVSPEFIKLTLSGAESTIRELDATQLLVEIDLEGLRKGEYSLPARIRLPEGVNLISAVPKRFNVTIE